MQAYAKSLGTQGTTMVLSPDSDFFRYFGNQKATVPPPAP
jgi:membrane protease subunit HflC